MIDSKNPIKVLLVEDDMLMGMVHKMLFESLGLDVADIVVSNRQAIEYLFSNRPDLIVVDVSTGPGNGFDAMEEIRKFSTVSVIFISGKKDEELAEKAQNFSNSAFLVKPLTRESLQTTILKMFGPGPGQKVLQSKGGL